MTLFHIASLAKFVGSVFVGVLMGFETQWVWEATLLLLLSLPKQKLSIRSLKIICKKLMNNSVKLVFIHLMLLKVIPISFNCLGVVHK